MTVTLHGPAGTGPVSYRPSLTGAENASWFPTSEWNVIRPAGSGVPLTVIFPWTVPVAGAQPARKTVASAKARRSRVMGCDRSGVRGIG